LDVRRSQKPILDLGRVPCIADGGAP